VTLPRQINQNEEGELQESIQGQRRCEIERAPPAFRSEIDEAERGDESQERDRNPDEDELDQSGSNHCLKRSASSSTTTAGYLSPAPEMSGGGERGHFRIRKAAVSEVAETGFPASSSHPTQPSKRSDDEKEE
jgi:hypothetical protein